MLKVRSGKDIIMIVYLNRNASMFFNDRADSFDAVVVNVWIYKREILIFRMKKCERNMVALAFL